MFTITKHNYGYLITFGDSVTVDEMKRWLEESKRLLKTATKGFGVLIDQRALRAGGILPDAQKFQQDGQKLYKDAGMARCCVVSQSSLIDMRAERQAEQSGIRSMERYINASKSPDWQAKALAWIEHAVEPV